LTRQEGRRDHDQEEHSRGRRRFAQRSHVQGCGDIDSDTTELSGALQSAETRFFIPPPDPGAVKQIAALVKARDLVNASV
jgi:hypothetical protein